MSAEHKEYVTDAGYVIRVNLTRSTFLVFKDNQPVAGIRSHGVERAIHKIPHVVFLGKAFDFSMQDQGVIWLCEVDGTRMVIPFRFKETSDIRHVKIPVTVTCDMLPVIITFFEAYRPGILPGFVSAQQYFVADEDIDRDSVIKLKARYPFSRVLIHREDRAEFYEKPGQKGPKDPTGTVRATDLLKSGNIENLSQNPVFAARVYLRQTDWDKLYDLPVNSKLHFSEVENILTFLRLMISKAPDRPELKQHVYTLRALDDYFQGLVNLLSFDYSRARGYLQSQQGSGKAFSPLIRALVSQMNFAQKEDNEKQIEFFSWALQMFENLDLS